MITIFTSLKSSDNPRVGEIQARAMANWREQLPGCEIEIFEGQPPKFAEVVRRSAEGESSVVMYANADVLFGSSIAQVVKWCEQQTEDFLIVGRRTDELEGGQRELHRPSGMDYFIFRKGMFADLPETTVGRAYYDSALLAYCLRRKIRVIDATDVLQVVHQWHDYGHVEGGRDEVFSGAEAQANKRNNRLRDFGPHIADVKWGLGVSRQSLVASRQELGVSRQSLVASRQESSYAKATEDKLVVRRKRRDALRVLGLWGVWNRVTRGGLGFWGIHEYVGQKGARFFTRSKIIQNFKNSNVVWKFNHLNEWPTGIYSGFDFPCMARALREKRRTGERWTLFLWDPPALSHRDRFPPLRWLIDLVWRWFARRCDKLVLNIHPGILEEIGVRGQELVVSRQSLVASGQGLGDRRGRWPEIEFRMQDAFDGLEPAPITNPDVFEYDFGVLSNWAIAKGAGLMTEVMRRLPDKSCLWIGNPPNSNIRTFEHSNISFAGSLKQEDAFERLRKCRVLIAPYLNVPSLKWNYVLKLFEYLQLGRPILASDNPGNVAVAEKFPGRITLFKSGDVDDLMGKLGVSC